VTPMEDDEFSQEEATVEELQELGVDLSERQRLEHYLYFPFASQAEAVAEELRGQGFEVAIESEEDGDSWLVLARHEIPISVRSLSEFRSRFESLAGVRGGEYDGWNVPLELPDDAGLADDD
jgi:regulator of RNase E activity RraB